MPIDIQAFKKIDYIDILSIKGKIIDFLNKNKNKAFEYTEISEAINESLRSVNANLSLLKEEGRVLHKRPYWAYNPDYSPTIDLSKYPQHIASTGRFPIVLRNVLEVSDAIINKNIPYKFAILNLAKKYNVTKSTIIDNCTRRLGINTYQFKELVLNKKGIIEFLIKKFPSQEEKIKEYFK